MKKGLPRRRALLTLRAACAAPALVPSHARAQTTLPDKSLRILVGVTAGGGAELMARVIAQQLERRLGRRVSVENKPNDTGTAAGEFLRKGLAEGTVVAFLPSTTPASTLTSTVFPFDSKSDVVPLTMAGAFQVVIAASRTIDVSTFAEYVAWSKSGPLERARLGATTTDAYLRIYSRMVGREIGVPLQDVPYRDAAALVAALKSGGIPVGLGSATPLLQHVRSGAVRFLMTSGRKRVSVLRTVPTAAELGHPSLELEDWYGFFASSLSPAPVLAEWNRQLRGVLANNQVKAELAQLGLDVETSTQEEAAARLASHMQAWKTQMESFRMKSAD